MGIRRLGRFETTEKETPIGPERGDAGRRPFIIFSHLCCLYSRFSGVVHYFLTLNVLGQSTKNYYLYLVHHTFHDRALIIITCATPTLTPDPALGANKRAASPALVPYVRYHSSVSTPSPHS